MADLDLNDFHVLLTLNFIKFCRYKRMQRMRSVDRCFQDVKDSRLFEDTYTVDEIVEMLDGLQTVVYSEMETELVNSNHMSVLLLRQLLTQAEKWHLNLSADMSLLENRELLEKVAKFEEKSKSGAPDFSKLKLSPADAKGGVGLLQREIERLEKENKELAAKSRTVEGHLTSLVKDNESLSSQVKKLGATPVASESSTENILDFNQAEVKKLQTELQSVKSELTSNLQSKAMENAKLSSELSSTMQQLGDIQNQLSMTEKELDKKFRETGAYKNLRDMLAKKNKQIKDYRERLSKHEPVE